MIDPESYVRSLTRPGRIITVDRNIPINRYFRFGSDILRLAKKRADEGELECVLKIYTQYIILFTEKVPEHPDYFMLSNAKALENKQILQSVIAKTEEVKTQVLSNYSKKYEVWKEQKEKEELQLAGKMRHLQLMEGE